VNLIGLERGLAQSQCVIAGDPDVLKQVAAVRDRIVAGQIVVPDPAGVIH